MEEKKPFNGVRIQAGPKQNKERKLNRQQRRAMYRQLTKMQKRSPETAQRIARQMIEESRRREEAGDEVQGETGATTESNTEVVVAEDAASVDQGNT